MPKHPVPKKKTSKARSSRRYKAFQNKARVRLADAVQLVKCSNCGATTRAHNACSECGFYKGVDAKATAQPEVKAKVAPKKSDGAEPSSDKNVTKIKAD